MFLQIIVNNKPPAYLKSLKVTL